MISLKKLITIVSAFLVVILFVFAISPIVFACKCGDAQGGCTGNCCFIVNGVCNCLDWGAAGCQKEI